MTLTEIDAREVTTLSDGATVTAANSASPDQFTPSISAPGTVKWRADNAISGAPAHWEFDGSGIARGDVAVNSATVAMAILGWMTNITASDNLIVRAFSASTSVSLTFRGSDRTLDVTANGGAILDSSPTIPANALYRIHFGVLKGTTSSNGAIRAELYIGSNIDGNTPDWTFTSTAANTGTANFTALRFGKQTSGPVHTYRIVAGRFIDTQADFTGTLSDPFLTTEFIDTLSMEASSGFSIGGSLSAAAVLAMDAVDGMAIGAVRSQFATLTAGAAGALTVAGVKSRLSVLPVAGLGSLAIAGATGAVSTLAVSGVGALAIAGSESRTAVWAAVAAAGLAVGAVRTQLAVLSVAGVSGLAIGTVQTRLGTLVVAATSSFVPNTGASAVWTARGTPLLVVGTVQSYLRVLAVRGTPTFAIGAVLIPDYHPNRRVTAAVLDSGLRKAVLLDATRLAKLLSPSYGAVITRGS